MKFITVFVIAALFLEYKTIAQPNDLVLWYDHPAQDWMTQALPVGNGRVGGMIFGGPSQEHIQFNEISLWTGDEKDTGAYQDFGDIYVDLDGDPGTKREPNIAHYRRDLDINDAVAHVDYEHDGVSYSREAFVSHPDQVLIERFTASKHGRYTGDVRLRDAHQGLTTTENDRLVISSTLSNGLAYEAQVMVLHDGGSVCATNGILHFDQANSVTIVLAAGTSYSPDYEKHWRGPLPHGEIERQLQTVAGKRYRRLLADHIKDYQSLFDRVELDLGTNEASAMVMPTDARLRAYDSGAPDLGLEQLLFQYGRYLLISSSRAGGLPANLQGLWNNTNNPPWRCDYHSNINVEMNYWPAEVAALPECHQCFLDYINHQREIRKKATQEYYHCSRG